MVVVMRMIIDITRLRSGIDEYADIDINYSFSQEQLKNTGILELNNRVFAADG